MVCVCRALFKSMNHEASEKGCLSRGFVALLLFKK